MKSLGLKFILCLCLSFFSINSFPQNNTLDSLKNEIENYVKRDTQKVNLILNYVGPTINDNLEENLPFMKEALSISEELDYKKGIGLVYNVYCSLYLIQTDLEKALNYGLRASKIFVELNDKNNILLVNTNLARIYTVNNKPEKALEIQLKSIEIIKNDKASSGKARFYFYAGKACTELKEFEQSIIYYGEAKKIAEASNFAMGIAIAEGSIAHAYIQLKKYNEALPLLIKTLNYSIENNQKSNIAASYNSIANCYAGLGDYHKSIEYNKKAEVLFKELNNLRLLKVLYESQYENYEKINDIAEANKYLKLHYMVADSILSIDKIKVIEDLQIEYETQKIKAESELNQKEKIIAQKESEQNRNYFIGAIAISILLLISFLFLIQRIQARRKTQLIALELDEMQKRLLLEKEQRKSELKALKAQMNPHFIFNAINSIQDLILKGDIDNSYNFIIKFAQLVRQTLNFSDKEFIDIEDEIQLLEVYLDLEKLRFKSDFEYTINKNNLSDFQIPPMLIQPFVENAIKHGLLHKDGLKKLEISFKKDDLFRCIVTDNGVGRKKAQEIKERQQKNYESFSVKATQNRFEIMKENYNQDLGVEYTDIVIDGESRGTKVVINMPFKQNY